MTCFLNLTVNVRTLPENRAVIMTIRVRRSGTCGMLRRDETGYTTLIGTDHWGRVGIDERAALKE
jgi:hypothetical protein